MSFSIFVNHLGYDRGAPKRAVLGIPTGESVEGFRIVREHDGAAAFEGPVGRATPVANWFGRTIAYATCDFSELDTPGFYHVSVRDLRSPRFEIGDRLILEKTIGPLMNYFRGQRCRGAYDLADREARFFGSRQDRVDVHGGWHDASGDVSKYLSHLSYANFMNPQQTPIVVYALLAAADLLQDADASAAQRLREEAAWGGDFLVRMQDPDGYFYAGVFDRWSKKLEERLICSFRTQKGERLETYRAGYRQGAGVAIAALARLALAGRSGEYPATRYLEMAEKAFSHLEQKNLEYIPDGRENIIDDYCALLASAELFAATAKDEYAAAARRRAQNLLGRLSGDEHFRGYWRAGGEDRPYFHAAEAGLPALALLRWAELSGADPEPVLRGVRASLRFETTVTDEVPNPFGYARQYVRPVGGLKRSSFFLPHENESGYWWQGENARLASLATLAAVALTRLSPDTGERERWCRYAYDQIDWILGRNPFDSCMVFGMGRNNLDYLMGWPNYPGGICNGITSGFDDEEDIAFLPAAQADDLLHNWRWTEQWLPHGAWFLLAVAALGTCRVGRAPRVATVASQGLHGGHGRG